jgi:hypothetical protein
VKIYSAGALISALMLAVPAAAQTDVAMTPAVAPPIVGASNAAMLRTGTPVPLKMAEMITTKGKKLKVGYRVHLEVAEDVRVNDIVVIPAGSPAIGELTDVRNKGMWGKSGKINAQLLYVTVSGRQIRLTGQFDDKGTTGTAAVVGSAVLIPVAGFFMTGTSAKIDIGTPVKAFVDEDVPLNVTAVAPTPLNVAAPAPVKQAQAPVASNR